MKDYFYLQYIRTERKLREAGINPYLAYLLGAMAFVGLSEYIFYQSDYAEYLVLLTCLSLLLNLSERNRIDFLQSTFGKKRKTVIRLVENLALSIPFIAILIFKNAYIECAILIGLTCLSAVLSFQTNFNHSTPTPFSRNPFEFTVGFRKTFLIFPIAYALAMIAIIVDNLGLGIFSMLLLFLTSLTYYLKPEDEYYVWVFSDSPKSFLLKKIRVATKSISMLTFPLALLLLIYFPGEFHLILLFFLIGILFLWAIILAKYSTYPDEINILEGILIAICIYFPPMLLLTIPYLYSKSINKLKLILNDKN